MLITRSLSRNGSLDISDIITSIIRWKRSDPIGTHNPIFDALEIEQENEDPELISGVMEKKIILSALLKNKSSLSNMCLHLSTPIAIATVSNQNDLLPVRLTKLTQPHPSAQDAVRVLTIALRSLIICPDPDIAYQNALNNSKSDLIRKHLIEAKKYPHPQEEYINDDIHLTEELPIDYIGITLQIAFYQLLHADSYSSGVINAISYGGDTTNNAAITGALLGTVFWLSNKIFIIFIL